MAITPVPAMTDTPPFPALADRAAGTYNSKAYAFGTHMGDVFNAEFVAVAASAFANATEAVAKAIIAYQAALDAADSNAASFSNSQQSALARDASIAARDVSVAAAAMAGTTAAFSDNVPAIKGASDATKKAYFYVSPWPTGTERQFALPDKSGVVALTSDIDHRPDTYITSSTSAALDFTNGGYVGYAPAPGSTATITIAGLTTTAIGQAGSFRPVVIEGYRLGASTLTWPTINWIKPDGSSTTNIALAGFTLTTSGIDFVILWKRGGGGTEIFGKVIR